MSDTGQQKITASEEYAELVFKLYKIRLRQEEKRLAQRKARDMAMAKIMELTRIQMRLNKRSDSRGKK